VGAVDDKSLRQELDELLKRSEESLEESQQIRDKIRELRERVRRVHADWDALKGRDK
jgi:hypothetical protein